MRDGDRTRLVARDGAHSVTLSTLTRDEGLIAGISGGAAVAAFQSPSVASVTLTPSTIAGGSCLAKIHGCKAIFHGLIPVFVLPIPDDYMDAAVAKIQRLRAALTLS